MKITAHSVVAALILVVCCPLFGGCTAVQSPTQNQMSTSETGTELLSNTGQNTQVWPDGSMQTGSTQLDSGVINPESTNWQGTAVSAILALGKNGAQVKNPGNLTADSLSIRFGTPYTEADGATIVPIESIEITGLVNEVTSVIDASTQQVALWVDALQDLAPAQAEAVIKALERDQQITSEMAGLIRAGLEAFAPVP